MASRYDYYADDRLETLLTAGPAGTVLQQDFSYDTLGRRDTLTETLAGHTTTLDYAYDPLSRLTGVTEGANTTAWTYDPFGNRRSHTKPGGAVDHYVHDAAHQLLEVRETDGLGTALQRFHYDANGNLTRKCVGTIGGPPGACTGDDVLDLQYDALDRLIQAGRTGLATEAYAYDPQGRRIQKTVGGTATHLHYDGSALYQAVEGSWASPVARYLHGAGIDAPLLEYTAAQTLAYHQDGRNSVVAVTDAQTGTLVAHQRFTAFGTVALASGTVLRYGFTGREPDATGLVHYRARYYDPAIGRFTQRDPLGFIDGVNRYAYAMNDPVNRIDPMGTVSIGGLAANLASQMQSYVSNASSSLAGASAFSAQRAVAAEGRGDLIGALGHHAQGIVLSGFSAAADFFAPEPQSLVSGIQAAERGEFAAAAIAFGMAIGKNVGPGKLVKGARNVTMGGAGIKAGSAGGPTAEQRFP